MTSRFWLFIQIKRLTFEPLQFYQVQLCKYYDLKTEGSTVRGVHWPMAITRWGPGCWLRLHRGFMFYLMIDKNAAAQ